MEEEEDDDVIGRAAAAVVVVVAPSMGRASGVIAEMLVLESCRPLFITAAIIYFDTSMMYVCTTLALAEEQNVVMIYKSGVVLSIDDMINSRYYSTINGSVLC